MKPITKRQALQLAVKALRKDKQQLAADASYHDVWKADYPAAVKASQLREQLAAAIELIEQMMEETVK